MDIAYYISDLLAQQGELTVPSLGYFVQIRMAAYYDNQEKKFYPPHYSVQFDPQIIDEDESLANYIAASKNISQASAKYFIEKYITNLKSQAVVEDVPFGNLGTFSSDGLKLTFKSATKNDDPAFFGHPAISVNRIGDNQPARTTATAPIPAVTASADTTATSTPANAAPEPTKNIPPPSPAPAVMAPLNSTPPQEEVYEDEPRKVGIWIALAVIVVALAIAAGAIYKYKPELFRKLTFQKPKAPVEKPVAAYKTDTVADFPKDTLTQNVPIQNDTVNVDTVNISQKGTKKTTTLAKVRNAIPAGARQADAANAKDAEKQQAAIPDHKEPAAANKKAPVITTPSQVTQQPAIASGTSDVAKGSWVIYGGAFPTRRSAERSLSVYHSNGLPQARLLSDKVKEGNNYKVIFGVYTTKAEAQAADKTIKKSHKIETSVELYK